MKQFLILAKKDFLELTRSKKFLILIIIFIFVAVASPILAKVTPLLLNSLGSTPGLTIKMPEPTFMDAVDQFVKNISQIALIVLVFIVAGSVADEKNRRNLEILLSKPVSRTKFIFSKFASYLGLISVLFVLSAISFFFYTVSIFGSFSLVNFILLSLLLLLSVLMVLSITMLASTFVGNGLSAAGIGYGTYILIDIIFGLVKKITKYSPNYILSNYKDLITNGWNSNFAIPAIIAIVVLILSLSTSIALFQRQEVAR
jgi:ABC-2 type transport system permease protein